MTEPHEHDGDYETLDDCIAAGTHLTNVDDDGYCNFCGHDGGGEDEDDVFDSQCRHCGRTLRSDTRQDEDGSTRCDDADPFNSRHVPIDATYEPVHVYATADGREVVIVFSGGGETGLTPVRNDSGDLRVAYLNADGTEPSFTDAEFGWQPYTALTHTRTY